MKRSIMTMKNRKMAMQKCKTTIQNWICDKRNRKMEMKGVILNKIADSVWTRIYGISVTTRINILNRKYIQIIFIISFRVRIYITTYWRGSNVGGSGFLVKTIPKWSNVYRIDLLMLPTPVGSNVYGLEIPKILTGILQYYFQKPDRHCILN